MIIQNFWFIVLAFTVIDFVWVRKLSSYGSKWMMCYTLWTLYMCLACARMEPDDYIYYGFDLCLWYFFFPLCFYICFNLIYKYIKNWKISICIDRTIHSFYLELRKMI